jgi:itaconate CoA-transferase
MKDLWAHPQLAARGHWAEVQTPAGPVKAPRPPGVNDQFDYRMDPIPRVGEHTNAILAELGLEQSATEALQ